MNELCYNWYALIVSVLCNCTMEQAFYRLDNGAPKKRDKFVRWTQEDIDAVVMYRDMGMSNREVGDMFGVGIPRISVIYNERKREKANEQMCNIG